MPRARNLLELPNDMDFVHEACHFAEVWSVNGELDEILTNFTNEAEDRQYTEAQCFQVLSGALNQFSDAPSPSFETAVRNIATRVSDFAVENEIPNVRLTVTNVAVAVYARYLLEAIFSGGMLLRS